ncbi:unnamed protein product, partial [marine sediment metagenome]
VIQNFLSTYIRHKSGEFYTPPFLVKKMVKESYKFGSKASGSNSSKASKSGAK